MEELHDGLEKPVSQRVPQHFNGFSGRFSPGRKFLGPHGVASLPGDNPLRRAAMSENN